MKKIKPSVKYQGVSLPVPFINEIKKHIKGDPKYRSIADFVRESVREKMEKGNTIKNINKIRKKDAELKFKEKYGMTYEEYISKPENEFSFNHPSIKEPTNEELEARINLIENKILTKEELKEILKELLNKKKLNNNNHGLL